MQIKKREQVQRENLERIVNDMRTPRSSNEAGFNTACEKFREQCLLMRELINDQTFMGGHEQMYAVRISDKWDDPRVQQCHRDISDLNQWCLHEAHKLGLESPDWWFKCWGISKEEWAEIEAQMNQ